MKKRRIKSYTIALATSVLTTISLAANAQKLPGTQAGNLYAPKNIKVDGKINEWGTQFQAYNNATNIFYTMANDKDNLYLAVQVTDPLIIRKVIIGGITLTIDNDSGKGTAITYPAFSMSNRPIINLKDKPKVAKNNAEDKMALDSFVNDINKVVSERSKEIKVKGVAAIPDSLISIYNDTGIKAVARFDEQVAYVYELAVPLKYLNNLAKFKYTITLSGSPQSDGTTIVRGATGEVTKIQVLVGRGAPSIPTSSERDIIGNATYLKGEYTLAVK